MLVITSDSVLANHEELSLDDETSSNILEDLLDPNPGNIPEPTPEFLLNLTINSEPIHEPPKTLTTSEPITSGHTQETYPTLFISLVSVEAFIRSMQLEGVECFSILTHEPIDSATLDKPKFNPDLKDVPEIYHEFADVFSNQKADMLPPHCDCDLKINVEEGAKLPAGSIYLLSTFELKTL